MPIEISQLTVTARVRDEADRNGRQEEQEANTEAENRESNNPRNELVRMAEIAQEIIKRQKER